MIRAMPRRIAGSVLQRSRRDAVLLVVAFTVAASVAVGSLGISLALFISQIQHPATFGSKALFPGERATPAFVVGDASSGSLIDRSSPFAVTADGLVTVTSAWSTAFATDRYVEFEFNDSLASGVAVTTANLSLALASSSGGEACIYLEVRRISTGEVVTTHGSPAGPLGCVTGTTPITVSADLAGVATTGHANDLRIRLFARDSSGGSMVIDLATVDGSTPHQDFTLYPVLVRDAADTTVETIPWALAVP
jgi:hypothetical protein